MKPTLRNYQTEEDYWRIREFLREVFINNNRHEFAWSLLRWDVNENIFHFDLQKVITLGEANGQIVAMVNSDGCGEAFFQIHPAFCTVWFDDVTRAAVFEPVGTHPNH